MVERRASGSNAPTVTPDREQFHFGVFELDLSAGELRKRGIKIKLQGQPLEILAMLLERPGEVVSREELRERLWASDTTVDFDNGLNKAINKLREALGDLADTPRFIETLPRHGYRFIAPVERPTGSEAESPLLPQAISHAPPKPTAVAGEPRTLLRGSYWPLFAASFVVVLVGAGFLWYASRPLSPPHIARFVQLTHDGVHKRLFGTDGARLFMNELYPQAIVQAPVSGSPVAPIPIDLKNFEVPAFWGEDLSPDGSSILAYNPGHGLFVVGVLGHPVRYLADGLTGSWSPDSKTVAFSNERGEIVEIAREGGAPRIVVKMSESSGNYSFISDLSWSPDGKKLRFTREHALWEIASDGSGLHPVLLGWNPSSWKCCGRWTAGGDFFIFVSGEANSSPYYPGAQLWVIDERHGQLRRPSPLPVLLDSGPIRWGTPVPSPDGNTVFAWGSTLRGQLVSYDRKSDQLQPYLGGISAEFVEFAKDEKSMAYVSFPEGILWIANRDGTEPVQLTAPPLHPKRIKWSPDGRQILFTDLGPSGAEALYVISAQGGEAKLLLPQEQGPNSDGNWSPDGSQVLFATLDNSRPRGHAGKADFRIVNLKTHAVTVLPGSEGLLWPRWSPDGRYIVGSIRDNFHLRVFDFESRRWTTLDDAKVAINPNWSHDGLFVYFLDILHDPIRISRVSISTGKSESIADLKYFHPTGWYRVWFGLDPEDRPMTLRDAGNHEIYALTLERR